MSEVKVHGLRAGYGTTEILHGISLTVPEGSTTAVLGDSGSGKTTVLRTIAGFIKPTEGSIEVGSRRMAVTGYGSRRNSVASATSGRWADCSRT